MFAHSVFGFLQFLEANFKKHKDTLFPNKRNVELYVNKEKFCSSFVGNPEIIRLLARKALENDSGFVSECKFRTKVSKIVVTGIILFKS